MSKSLKESTDRFKAYCINLSQAMAQFAETEGLADPLNWGEAGKRQILRAIERRKSEKLRDWSYEKRTLQRRPKSLTAKRAIKLVRIELNEPLPKRMTPTAKRAVALLCGSRPKAKKNPVEQRAVQVASAIRNHWAAPQRKTGRPSGSKTRLSQHVKFPNSIYQIPLSISEVISVVVPALEEFIGKPLTGSTCSVSVISAALEAASHHCEHETIVRLLARHRQKVRARREEAIPFVWH